MNITAKFSSNRRVLLMVWIAIFLMKLSIGIFHILAAQRYRAEPLQFGLNAIEYHGKDPETEKTFNSYSKSIIRTIDAYERNNQRMHLLAAYGYFVAAATSLTSAILELRSLLRGNR